MSFSVSPRFGGFVLYSTCQGQDGLKTAQSVAEAIRHEVPSFPVEADTYRQSGKSKGALYTGDHALIYRMHQQIKKQTGIMPNYYEILG